MDLSKYFESVVVMTEDKYLYKGTREGFEALKESIERAKAPEEEQNKENN